MVKRKKSGKKKSSKPANVSSDLNLFQREINKDVSDVEGWVIARRKFFKRLGYY